MTAPTAVVLGTLTNKRGQVVLRAVVGMEFFAPGGPAMIDQDVPELLERAASEVVESTPARRWT